MAPIVATSADTKRNDRTGLKFSPRSAGSPCGLICDAIRAFLDRRIVRFAELPLGCISLSRQSRRNKLLFLGVGIVGDFAVDDYGDVAARGEELHDFRTFTGKLGPARLSLGILLEGAVGDAVELEIDLG